VEKVQKQIRLTRKGNIHKSLGWYLGALKGGRDNSLSEEEERKMTDKIKIRLNELNSGDLKNGLYAVIPNDPCPIDQPYIKDNLDFFLSLFLQSSSDNDCLRIARHMNTCMTCFDILSQTIRDYYHSSNAQQL